MPTPEDTTQPEVNQASIYEAPTNDIEAPDSGSAEPSNTSDGAEGAQNTSDGRAGRQAEAPKNTEGVPSNSASNTGDTSSRATAQSTPASAGADKQVELSESSLKRLADAVKSGAPVKQNAELKKLSPEEIDAQLKMLKIGADHLKACGFEDPTPEQIAGFQKLFDSHRENVLTMTNVLLEGRIGEVLKQYEGQFNYLQERQLLDQRENFYSRHTELKPFEKFVTLVAKDFTPVKPDGSQMTVAEAEEAIVKQTLGLLEGAGVKLDSNATQNAASKAGVPKMAQVAGAGRSVSSGQTKTMSRDESIYSDL